VSLTTLLLIPPALWMGYTWGAHLLTLGAIRRGPRSGRRVALTFDDGPDLVHTPKLLDLLHEVGARGTFFLVGQRVSQARALVRRIAAEGHEVGNHTWSHRNLWTCGPRETEREIERGHRILEDVAERAPSWFRPPWGAVNLAVFRVIRRLRTPCVLWSVQPEGLRPVPPDRLTSHLLTHAHPGAIVDLHDAPGVRGAPERLLAALPSMLSGLRARGYELVPLGTLLSGA
jgi:peptidoglycan/xylan/chitin deacetylase (PgdA/CDA1 family)